MAMTWKHESKHSKSNTHKQEQIAYYLNLIFAFIIIHFVTERNTEQEKKTEQRKEKERLKPMYAVCICAEKQLREKTISIYTFTY